MLCKRKTDKEQSEKTEDVSSSFQDADRGENSKKAHFEGRESTTGNAVNIKAAQDAEGVLLTNAASTVRRRKGQKKNVNVSSEGKGNVWAYF